jgi:hypothetical protein
MNRKFSYVDQEKVQNVNQEKDYYFSISYAFNEFQYEIIHVFWLINNKIFTKDEAMYTKYIEFKKSMFELLKKKTLFVLDVDKNPLYNENNKSLINEYKITIREAQCDNNPLINKPNDITINSLIRSPNNQSVSCWSKSKLIVTHLSVFIIGVIVSIILTMYFYKK